MSKKTTKKKVIKVGILIFGIHFLLSFLFKNLMTLYVDWKLQIIESLLFSVIMIGVFWVLNIWNKQWKK